MEAAEEEEEEEEEADEAVEGTPLVRPDDDGDVDDAVPVTLLLLLEGTALAE